MLLLMKRQLVLVLVLGSYLTLAPAALAHAGHIHPESNTANSNQPEMPPPPVDSHSGQVENDMNLDREINMLEDQVIHLTNQNNELEVRSEASPGAQAKRGKQTNLVVGKDKRNVQIVADNNKMKIVSQGERAETLLTMQFDSKSNDLEVNINGQRSVLNVMPDKASSIAKERTHSDLTQKVELLENKDTSSEDKAIFKVSGIRQGRLLGIIPIVAETNTEVGAQTGKVLKMDLPVWFKVLSPLIFK